jgi:hypothetical protein
MRLFPILRVSERQAIFIFASLARTIYDYHVQLEILQEAK